VKANYIPTSNADFHAFLKAIRLSPTGKILICLVMEDPVIQAKKLEVVRPIMYLLIIISILKTNEMLILMLSCRRRLKIKVWPSAMAPRKSALGWKGPWSDWHLMYVLSFISLCLF
jgi:hypothetical protein